MQMSENDPGKGYEFVGFLCSPVSILGTFCEVNINVNEVVHFALLAGEAENYFLELFKQTFIGIYPSGSYICRSRDF